MTNDTFLEQLESELKDRYTELDVEYTKCMEEPRAPPPILKIVCKKQRSYYENRSNNTAPYTRHDNRNSNYQHQDHYNGHQNNGYRNNRRPAPYDTNRRGRGGSRYGEYNNGNASGYSRNNHYNGNTNSNNNTHNNYNNGQQN